VAGPSSLLGPVEFLILWALKEVFSGGVFGLPAGDRDPNLLRLAPADAVAYVEWAGRGPGKEGAPGIDGLMADLEIKSLLAEVDKAMAESLGEESEVDNENPLFSRPAYEALKKSLARPGGGYVRIDPEAVRKGIDDGLPVDHAILTGIEAAVVVNAGDQAEALAQDLLTLLNALSENEDEPTELQNHLVPTTLPHFKLFIHRHENYIIFGLGPETVARIIARLSNPQPGLETNARFTQALKPLAAEHTASLAWVDVQGALNSIKSVLGIKGLILTAASGAIGLDSIHTFTRVTRVENGEVRTRCVWKTDGRTTGLLAFAAGRGLTPADFAHIPADAHLVEGLSVNFGAVLAGIKELAGKLDPEARKAIDEGLKQWEDESGFSIAEALAAFGDAWTLHASPAQGGALLNGAVLSLEVRDAARARSVIDKLQSIFSQMLKSEDGIEGLESHFAEVDFLGCRIVWIESPPHAVEWTPAFCLTDHHLLVALSPQPLKAQLRFLQAKRPGYDQHLIASTPSPEGAVLHLSRVDARSLLQTVSSKIPEWGSDIASRLIFSESGFDTSALPSAEAVLPYAMPWSSEFMRRKDGFESESRGGLTVPGGCGLLLQLLYWLREPEFEADVGAMSLPTAPFETRSDWTLAA
jgi:hypothetical protein